MCKVSVIVPVYITDEDLLRKCIMSILNQTLEDIELILVDDGTPDKGGQVCDEYADIDKRISVIHKRNEGVSVARNVGIVAAKGKYLSFVDADDWLETTMLERLYYVGEKNKSQIIQCTYFYHCDKNIFSDMHTFQESHPLKKKEIFELIGKAMVQKHISYKYQANSIASGAPWAKLYDHQFILENTLRFVPGLVRCQDKVFNLYAYNAAERIYYLDEALYHYVNHLNSAVTSYRSNIEKIYLKYLEEIRKFLESKKPNNEILRDIYIANEASIIRSILLSYYFHKESPLTFLDKWKQVKNFRENSAYQSISKVNKFKYNKYNGWLTNIIIFLIRNKLYFFLTCFFTLYTKYNSK
jgi:glycosyltransferase EpsH